MLAAGAGSRLRAHAPVKPLVTIGERPLLHHVLDALADAGTQRAVVVTGHGQEDVATAARAHRLPVDVAHNPDWASSPNGVSLLAGAARLSGPALLVMGDHLVSPGLVRRVASAGRDAAVTLGVDRRLGHPWVDEADVTRVRTAGDRIEAIGKTLAIYDAYDTGVFRITPSFLDVLAMLDRPSLSEGVALAARRNEARVTDCGDESWLDVDDGRALALARRCWTGAR